MKTCKIRSGQPLRRATLMTLLTAAAILATLVSCTRPRLPTREKARNPLITEHMKNVQRGAQSLASSLDDGNSGAVDDTAKYIASEFLQTRALPLAEREDGEAINMTIYTRQLDKAIALTEELRRALYSNRWDVASERYNDLRAACIRCHSTYVDHPIQLALPSARNF